MLNNQYTEKTENFNEQIKSRFKLLTAEEIYNRFADAFDVEITTDKEVAVIYNGAESVKVFKRECWLTLLTCIYSVFGEDTKAKIVKSANPIVEVTPKAKNNIKALKFFVIGMIFVFVATAIMVVLCNYIGNRNFRETFYNVSSIKVDSNIRVIQLSDLHKTTYGKDNEKLIERVAALAPDIIICTGDIVDSATEDIDFAVDLGKKLTEIAPTYYVYGNNEVETVFDVPLNEKELDEKFGFDKNNRDETALLKVKDAFEEELEKNGIKVLKNEKDTIKVRTMNIDIYGVLTSNPSSFWSYSGTAFSDYVYENADNIKITAVHEPFIFEEFDHDYWGDLIVCGHTHGGVMRIPVLGPLFTREDGLFPERSGKFVYGKYSVAGSPLIVSAGLENSNPLRINNEPELVIIDINKF